MLIADESEAVTVEHHKRTYFFCSEGCRDKFLAGSGREHERSCYEMIVIGGGPAGITAAVYAARLTMDCFVVEKIEGEATVSDVTIRQLAGEECYQLPVQGVFISIGLKPNSSLLDGLVESHDSGEIVIGKDCSTSCPGLFAAGDVTDAYGKRIIIAAGEGANACLAAKQYMLDLRKGGHVHAS